MDSVGNQIADVTSFDIVDLTTDLGLLYRKATVILAMLQKGPGQTNREAILNASKSELLLAGIPLLGQLVVQIPTFVTLQVDGVRIQLACFRAADAFE